MKAIFKPSRLCGAVKAPPSKSMAHRLLIGAAICSQSCEFYGVDYSEDILATIACLEALGVVIKIDNDKVVLDSTDFLTTENPVLDCRESGSTLRFFIPLALCMGRPVTFIGSGRLFERPLEIYEKLCEENGFLFTKSDNSLTVCGKLESGEYTLKGNVSSQFITGLIFALVYLGGESLVEIIPPFESRPYVDLTVSALNSFGVGVEFVDDYKIAINPSIMHSYCGEIEGDYSNAAFFDALNYLGSDIKVLNLKPDSLQGDRIYKEYFKKINQGTPTLDISDCPDLAPVLFALAALKNGAKFIGTDRLKVKESDRGLAMHNELQKLGGGLVFGENSITVPKQTLKFQGEPLNSHNDHRIVMALSVILSALGGEICGIEAVKKSYPSFFDDVIKLNAQVEII